ncbi:nose resistant to fluoxetine protein 6-like [Gigantopelta aegis]|uniref:nose resistant to fluoxetine protein 6-like n=1 Tax=Gigantopelta aegis TaxID=1735272 RepID=UPI001B88BDB4|nr:nose resistant to fluoxetine protein 6-like [Gigantopelta aegis]
MSRPGKWLSSYKQDRWNPPPLEGECVECVDLDLDLDPAFYTCDLCVPVFDAMGKPAGGITKGNLYFLGEYELCMSTHAHVPAGIIIGNKTREVSRDFDTKFCRAAFNLPDSVVNAVTGGLDTRGVQIRVNWGLCLPSSCSSHDVPGLLSLGPLAQLNLSAHVYKVFCVEDHHMADDGSALATAIILGLFVVVAIFSTAVHSVSVWFRANCKPEDSEDIAGTYELEGAVNKGFVSDEKTTVMDGDQRTVAENGDVQTSVVSDLPPGYMEHKNDKGLPEHVYTPLAKPEVISVTLPNGGQNVPAFVKSESPRRPPPPSVVEQLMKAFSLYNNVPKLVNCKKSPSAIHCIHGIRFFSIMWIILGHTYNYGIISVKDNPTTANLVEADNVIKELSFQVVQAGDYSVDTFFMISGMLVTWLTLKDLAKKKLSAGYLAQFVFHRFWRLTPIYMFVLAGFGCLYTYLGSGPLWPEAIKAADMCKENWWTNLLYVNNLVRVDDMCMGWSWYLSNDMQFYLISPLLIIPMYFYAPIGLSLTVLLMFGGIASAFYKEYIYGGDLFQKKDKHYWNEVYVAPWCRVSAWCVGMILGYIMYKYKKSKLRQIPALIGWILAIGCGLTLSYITYDYRKDGAHEWPRTALAFKEAFGRPIWAICVAWVVYACHKGRGAVINSILSFGGLIPLSRLTYAAYLVHPIMMIIYVYSKRTLVYIDNFDIAYLYMGHVCTTYMAAFGLSMIFESPFLTLEKIMFQRGGHKD